jgi:hypothetical protein
VVGHECALVLGKLANTCRAEREEILELRAGKGLAFRSRLNFDEAAASGHDDVHINFGSRIFVVRQIKQSLAIDQTH